MTYDRRLARALLGLGTVVLLLALLDVRTPLRPWLTLAFFALAPGAACVPRLRIREPLMAASLVLGISIAISMGVSMAMLWTGVSSPILATAVVLAVTAVALADSGRAHP